MRLAQAAFLFTIVLLGILPLNAGIISFDEFGNATYVNGGSTVAVPFSIGLDPTGGVAGSVLIYDIGAATGQFFVNGDAVIGDETAQFASDILRFTDPAGNFSSDNFDATLMIFYSADITSGTPADSGLPENSTAQCCVAIEIADDTFTFNPGGISYQGFSGVPEPASSILLGGGLLAVGIFLRRKTR